jgi:hypothetical protein
MMAVSSYPLSWPAGFPRTNARETGRFKTSFDNAKANVVKSLKGFAADSNRSIVDPILSTNVDLMGNMKDRDPGVAVWFTWDGMQVCIPVDRYHYPASNLQAIHHILEARRVELRHGSLALIRATFQGFKALPQPKSPWEVLGLARGASVDAIQSAYRSKARGAHPDAGGSTAAMAELNAARDAALREVGR